MLASAQLAVWLDQSQPGASSQLIAFKIVYQCVSICGYRWFCVCEIDQVELAICLDTKHICFFAFFFNLKINFLLLFLEQLADICCWHDNCKSTIISYI